MLGVRRQPTGRLYVCDGGVLGSVTLPQDATDRGVEPGVGRLSFGVLVEVAAVVAALTGPARREGGR